VQIRRIRGMNEKLHNFLDVTRDLIKKFRIINREQQYCYNVTLSQGSTIRILARKGKVTMGELSKDLGVSRSTMTRIVDILVRDTIIKRGMECGDRRQVCVELTEKGLNLYNELEESSTAYLSLFLKALPEHKQDDVIEALRLFNKAIGDVCPP
jgi:DNA-binding MarR family transcriptional regulator